MNTKLLSLMTASIMGAAALGSGMAAQERLTPELFMTMSRVGEMSLSPDGKTAVYAVSFPDVKANKASRELFTVALDGTGRKQITETSAGEYAPVWMNDGKRIAFMTTESGSMQLWTMRADGTDRRQLSDIEGGITGFLFSPDEKQVLFTKNIKYGKRTADLYPDLDKATGRIVTDLMYKHWDEWVETIPHPFLAVVADGMITSGRDILEGEPYEAPMKPWAGIEDFSWSPDGQSIAYACRKKTGKAYSLSTNSDIYIYNIPTGKTRNISEGMMGYDTYPKFSPDGKQIAWISMERDGYESDLKRLFVADLTTGERKHVNPTFDYNVDMLQWTPDSKGIYFLACKEAETHLWEIALRSGKIRRITAGQHDYADFSVRNNTMLAKRHSYEVPDDLYNVSLKNGEARAITAENKAILDRLSPITCEKRWMETTDGGRMLTWIVFPPNFDKNKKYPAILYCQGGPQNTVSQFWSFRWNMRLMAEQGYIVIAPNRHGVPGFGQKWNEQISGDYGGQNMRDYFTAVDEMRKEPYVDADHIGAVGASYGGFSVYWLAGHHEGRFAAFIAHAGIFNMEMQYATTEEMWFANWDMGGAFWDKDNMVAQRTYATSPHKFVQNWDTPILMIHGELDFRILASQAMAAFNAAQLRGVPSEMLIYPDENHWILQPQNALLFHRTFFGWLDRWLKP
ncbi:S9 family peptidase [Porphyromonas loveana]|uniref:S9 family peptidase n=1 Tax=Porphyromonas loveana TaxID=1884669 RepID=UPI0035A117BE